MTRAIHSLLVKAAWDALNNGGLAVSADIQMKLAAEGYDLSMLADDVERITEDF